ncbi:DUF4843 domain-containing protein [Echinicola marina]|uniref:DUF4843 domain-containing protein n=1 Tax=Echinicola marina TaxID=2859768 RepID=UPI001CF6AA06|nr:DUF4843 domain-containing protein [Echinicola marina]UCS93421.1 DUF4843 domain-containing protein [Echinicola marina]
MMRQHKSKYIYLLVALVSFMATSCFDDPGLDTVWSGVEIEFNDANLPNGYTENFEKEEGNTDQTDMGKIQVNLVGAAGTSDLTVQVEADPSSTAIQGVHYNLPSNTVTIPAGEVTATLMVEVLIGNIGLEETPDLVLKITDASGAKISANYGELTYKMRMVCASQLEGTYSVFWETLILGDGSGGASQTLTNYTFNNTIDIAEVGTGVYQLSDMTFGLYPNGYGDSGATGRISDNCNDITGDASNTDQYGDPFTISGTADPINGTIRIVWSNTYGDGGTVVLTKQ